MDSAPYTADVQGAGPEQVQQRKARRNVFTALFSAVRAVAVQDPVASGFVSLDTPNPQRLRPKVTAATSIRDDPTGRWRSSLAHTPPRQAPASWDGEPGFTAPHEG
jgi:hypothetical protein